MSFETLPPFHKVFGDVFVANFAQSPHQIESEPADNSGNYNSGKWTEKEEADLHNAVLMFGMQDVAVLQAAVRTRTKVQVRNRIQKLKVKQEYQAYVTKD